jgi:hypothetical protein
MKGMSSVEWDSGWGEDGVLGTWEWLLDPTYIVAQVAPYYFGGGGLLAAGVVGWRQRPDPNGGEIVTNHYHPIFNWPGCAYIDHCSSVTFGILTGNGDQRLKTVLNLFFW